MPWRGPSYRGEFPSLGWSVSDWITDNLLIPDGANAGEPLVLTDEQLEILVRFYRVDPKNGRSVYRRAAVVRPKGWGKSPFLAAIALAEACGPVRFVRWDGDGEPVGAPPPTPWVQIAAVSEDQTDNTYRSLRGMVAAGAAIVANYDLDVGLTRINVPGGGLIEPVTASSGTREGQRVTFAVLDETHLWLPEKHGPKLAATIRRNVGKMDGRTFESTNAWAPGEGSVAETTSKAVENREPGILIDHRVPVGDVSLSNKTELRRAVRHVYGEAAGRWIDVNRILAEIRDPATTEEDARRFYLNQVTARTDQWVDAKLWARLGGHAKPEAGAEITVGFVGLAYQGAALIGCSMETGTLFEITTWQTSGAEMVPRSEVNAEVEAMMAGFTVRRFYVDPREWTDSLDAWALQWPETVIAWWTHRNTAMAHAVDRLRTAVGASEAHHDGSQTLTDHVLRSRSKVTAVGTLIVPRTDAPTDQITAAKAAVLAYEARADVLTLPVEGPSVYESERGLLVL